MQAVPGEVEQTTEGLVQQRFGVMAGAVHRMTVLW
jgi:hypothetical protein